MNKLPCPCGPNPVPRKTPDLAAFLLSGATLVLMPKCPVCVATYVALVTGVSVSTAVAAGLRTSLIVCALAVPLILVLIRFNRIYRKYP